MMIDQVFPQIVAEHGTLKEQLFLQAKEQGLSEEQVVSRFGAVPNSLMEAGAFLDKMTGLWRYEFGMPFEVKKSLVWGTHMWVPIGELHQAIITANTRLSEAARGAYFARLSESLRHLVTLAEMIPGHRVSADVPGDFEQSGYGEGKSTVDWIFHANGRKVIIDVKSRSKDFIEQMEQGESSIKQMPEPSHDAGLLFRSLDKKFLKANPSELLQGVWISTHLQQNEHELNKAFAALDADKVHFAVFGDWRPDIHLLVRREEDRQYLLDFFQAEASKRFTFTPGTKA